MAPPVVGGSIFIETCHAYFTIVTAKNLQLSLPPSKSASTNRRRATFTYALAAQATPSWRRAAGCVEDFNWLKKVAVVVVHVVPTVVVPMITVNNSFFCTIPTLSQGDLGQQPKSIYEKLVDCARGGMALV